MRRAWTLRVFLLLGFLALAPDLVSLGKFFDPHDMNGLVQSIKPKLVEETHQERMMLQQNGIEDMFPLDATVELGHRKRLPRPIEATEVKTAEKDAFGDSNDDEEYMKDMPEYNVETKADYKGNEEAAEWLMNNPNKFNVMPEEDSKGLVSEDDLAKQGAMSDEADAKSGSEKAQDVDDSKLLYTEDPMKQGELNDDVNSKETSDKVKTGEDDDEAQYSDKTFWNTKSEDDPEKIYSKYEKFASELEKNDAKTESERVKDATDFPHGKHAADTPSNHDVTEFNGDTEGDVTITNDDENADTVQHGKISVDDNRESKVANKLAEEEEESKEAEDMVSASKSIEEMMNKLHMNTGDKGDGQENSDKTDFAKHKPSYVKALKAFLHKVHQSKPPKLVPVYRITHLPRLGQKALRLRHKATDERPGTSRQNIRQEDDDTGDRDPTPSELRHLESLMIEKTTGDQDTQRGGVPGVEMLHPQISHEGDQRHGIPSRFGEWNGWSTCSVSCGSGSKMRARICRKLPCQSRDLYQTKPCAQDVCPSDWVKESLSAHNRLRSRHHSPPLTWSKTLEIEAKQIAKTLASRDYIGSQDLHEDSGENIAQLRANPDSLHLARKAVELWYNEVRSYSFAYPQLTPKDRHFVQMIWRKTRAVGMAHARSPSGEYTFVVALYGGPGIDRRTLRANVLRAGRSHDVYTEFRAVIPRVGHRHHAMQ
ncbi:uncharacterized protein LOC5505573 isoform X2 [Nematostella vectensis]|uniref:uncharacterized protein LOC5505573 isoform X2 n=1 Tax=Nematostella vectensis TaxID=45351 RepID=UPI00207704C3|nr:uncharacterized protein LOC5505573 isoform X2 [Nematostella vectensis]